MNLNPSYCTKYHHFKFEKIRYTKLEDKGFPKSGMKNIMVTRNLNDWYYMGCLPTQYAVLIPKLIMTLTLEEAFIKVNSVNLKELATLKLLTGGKDGRTNR